AHGDGAHEADADLRDQPRQLGDSRHAMRAPVSRNVAAVVDGRAAARGPLESGNLMTAVERAVIECVDVHLSRGVRQVLRGVSFEMRRGETVALMGSSGAGKTTILRAIAGLDPIDRGEIAVGGVRV